MKISTTFMCMAILVAVGVSAQNLSTSFEVPTTNPKAVVQQRLASTNIEITYSRPSTRGRTIFGDLVPYDQVWRTGADAATRISFSTPVMVEGSAVDSGTYELFTIPGEQQWTIILQGYRGQWGSYSYDPAFDAVRVQVTPETSCAPLETFTISVDDVKRSEALMHISWSTIRVPVRISVDLESTVVPQLEALLESDGRRPYFLAAMFYFENDLDIDRAAELMTLAVEQRPKHLGMLYRLALILERKGDIAGARDAAKRSLAEASTAGEELREEYIRLNLALLERLKSQE